MSENTLEVIVGMILDVKPVHVEMVMEMDIIMDAFLWVCHVRFVAVL